MNRLFALLVALLLPLAAAADPALQIFGRDGRLLRAYELDELKAMPQVTIRTENEFVNGMTEFRGPLMRDVLRDAGGEGARLAILTAANDYQVEIPTEEFTRYDVILALTMNGKPLSRRTKGPIWVIYPMSDHPELQDAAFNNRLIWQLVRIDLQ